MVAQRQQTNRGALIKGPRSWAAILIVVVIMIIGAAFWLSLPRATIAKGQRGLVKVALGGWNTSVQSATFVYAGKTASLALQGDLLKPTRPLPSGVLGTVHLVIDGDPFLRRIFGETKTLSFAVDTPTSPVLKSHYIDRLLEPYLSVAFGQPVDMVKYDWDGTTKTMRWLVPKLVVNLPMAVGHPGSGGSMRLQAGARSWETPSAWQEVRWTTIPYIHAFASPTVEMSPNGVLTVTFSQPIARPNLRQWVLTPKTPGAWHQTNSESFTYTPSDVMGFGPGALVSLTIPGGRTGPLARSGSYLAQALNLTWTTVPGSVLRLQQLLAEEGYLPVTWQRSSPASGQETMQEQAQTIYNPPLGTFQWEYPNLPASLKLLWAPGQMTVMTKGAIMQFERANGLTVDGIAGPAVWRALLSDRLAGKTSPDGYTYISVTENAPETMQLWVNGQLLLSSDANTGISVTPTYLGTYPIYERLPFQIMRGNNPNGTPYADPVYWINYFAGSDAVHGFFRSSYGFPQSLGCVELPLNIAPIVYHDVHYGTLVTVSPVGVAPAPAKPGASASNPTSTGSSTPSSQPTSTSTSTSSSGN